MKRTLDETPFNIIANHPEVRPWLGFNDPTQEANLAATVRNTENICFLTEDEDGGYILLKHAGGLYSAHTLALPSARGRKMLRLMHDGFDTMFTATDCVEITTSIPEGNDNAKAWSDAAGFRDTFKRAAAFRLMDELVPVQYRTLTYAEWVARSRLAKLLGETFHAKLDQARGFATHTDEEIHNRWVGATLGCAIEQNLAKGIGLYNRWAVIAGYAVANVLNQHPPLVDIGDGVVQLLSGAMDVLQVRRALNSPESGEPT